MKKPVARARRGGKRGGSKVEPPKRIVLRNYRNQKENGKSRGKGGKTEENIVTRKKTKENRAEPVISRRGEIKATYIYKDDLSSNHSDNDDDSSYHTAVEEEEEEDSSCAKGVVKKWIRKNADDDDDDEYVPSTSECSDSDDEETGESSLDDDDDDYLVRIATSSTSKRKKVIKHVVDKVNPLDVKIRATRKSNSPYTSSGDEDVSYIFSIDETDDGADEDDSRKLIKVNKKSNKNSSYNPGGDNDFSNIFSMDETDEDADEVDSHNFTSSHSSYKPGVDEDLSNIFSMDETDDDADEDVSPSKRECCQNTVDAITDCPLEPIHVCWKSPDGENRQCYNLDTLRKVSISRDKDVLLEPPHFRCDISAKLQEQILLKFGRMGLLVHDRSTRKGADDNSGEMYDSDDDNHFFQERFNAYMHELMGSRDIYVCPICYCYKYNALAEVTISDHKVSDIITSRSFEYDPMSVLIYKESDHDDDLHVASTYCFRLLKDVKHHITNVHKIDLAAIKGNDLFKGYQIRAPDGLLQRWLKIRFPRTIDAQDMRRYWADGYNRLDYLELAFLVDHDQLLRRTDLQFYESFQDQALTLWEMISGAFERLENDELDDFIVDEGLESDTSDVSGPQNINLFNEESDPEVEFVKRLRARRAADSTSSSGRSEEYSSEESEGFGYDNESQMDSDDDSDCNSEDIEEEEDDEWLSQKLLTPKKMKRSSPFTSAKVTSSGKFSKLRKLSTGSPVHDSETDQDIEDSQGINNNKVVTGCFESDGEKEMVTDDQAQYSATKKKRAVIESDDSE